MLKRLITYKDFNGDERQEYHYFHFMESEIQEMNLKMPGGLTAHLNKIVEEKDPELLVEYFKSLILDSYGIRTEDGRSFLKKDKDGRRYADAFAQTAAYNTLFMELTTDTKAAVDFVNAIIPEVPDPEKKKSVEDMTVPADNGAPVVEMVPHA